MKRPPTVILPDGRVRRIAHEGSATIQALLHHLRSTGIDFVPEPLSLVGDREELSFLPGDCYGPTDPRPEKAWDHRYLVQLARALRECHDASIAFMEGAIGAPWFPFAEQCDDPEIICHNDLGPWNVPISDTGVAIIDWAMASPGRRIQDVAQLAWNWVPFYPAVERAGVGAPPDLDLDRRLTQLLEAYGLPGWTKRDILEEVLRRQTRLLNLVALARQSKAMMLQNWAQVDERPILADRGFVTEALKSA